MTEQTPCCEKPKMKKKTFVIIVISLLSLIVLIQGVQLYFTIKPFKAGLTQGLSEEEKKTQEQNRQILQKVAKLTKVGENEQALILTIEDVEAVKKSDPLNAQVYKNAKNKDRIIRFADRMIIFNEAENKIVYEGKTPLQLQQEKYLGELQEVITEVSKLATIDLKIRPQMLTVVDPAELKKQDAQTYKDVLKDDKILVYTDRMIIYRPSTKKIILDKKLEVKK